MSDNTPLSSSTTPPTATTSSVPATVSDNVPTEISSDGLATLVTRATATSRALTHLKGNQTLYTVGCMVSLIVGVYMDYRSTTAQLDEQTTSVAKSTAEVNERAARADQERVANDETMQRNIQRLLDYAVTLEGRLATLEEKTRRLESDSQSLLKYLFGLGQDISATTNPPYDDDATTSTHKSNGGNSTKEVGAPNPNTGPQLENILAEPYFPITP